MTQVEDRFGALSEPTTLTIQRILPGPIERVWAYVTDGDLRRKWLAAGDMPLAPGASFELVWRNDDLSAPDDPRPDGFGAEQRMRSHVVSVDPPHRLTIAWGAGDVTFELEPAGQKVLMTVIHRGLDDRGARIMIAAGWHMHLDILVAEAEGREPGSFWAGWAALKAIYRTRLPL